ncbi:MAG: serine/threonine-protein phosphatase [Deltaproteobacteria bacterium]|nr:serine/threonine-protein phosphatase [Deltaproteobacteria bacterium]
MHVIAAGLTNVGLQREHNEDSFCLLGEYSLFLVADGMGGHRAGDVASRMATAAIAAFFRSSAGEDATWPFHFDTSRSIEENRLITGIKLANRHIYDVSNRSNEHHGMGTTVVGVLFSPEKKRLYVGHVGDSRCYRLRRGELQLMTRDHSLINDYLIAMPDLPDEQRDELPRNVITRALGMSDLVTVDLIVESPEVGDVYMLCSDGLSSMLTAAELAEGIAGAAEGELADTCRSLIGKANEAGGEDNITTVLVRVEE